MLNPKTGTRTRALAIAVTTVLLAVAAGAGAADGAMTAVKEDDRRTPPGETPLPEPTQDADAVLRALGGDPAPAAWDSRWDAFAEKVEALEQERRERMREDPPPRDVGGEAGRPDPGARGDVGALDTRTDTTDKPVLVVHGRKNTDMSGFWDMVRFYEDDYGYSGGVYRVGYYGGECSVEYRAEHHGSHAVHYGGSDEHESKDGCISGTTMVHDQNTKIEHLAYHLAWLIHDHFSVHGIVVDTTAHSMGGLLIRYAIAQQDHADFPDQLLVEDITTMGTPHDGLGGWCWFSPYSDVRQMCSSASFMEWLRANAQDPQASGWSTDWTLMGSDCDEWVNWDSATGMDANHKLVYVDPCYGHSDYYKDTSTAYDATVDWQDAPDETWYRWYEGPRSVLWSSHALYVGTW